MCQRPLQPGIVQGLGHHRFGHYVGAFDEQPRGDPLAPGFQFAGDFKHPNRQFAKPRCLECPRHGVARLSPTGDVELPRFERARFEWDCHLATPAFGGPLFTRFQRNDDLLPAKSGDLGSGLLEPGDFEPGNLFFAGVVLSHQFFAEFGDFERLPRWRLPSVGFEMVRH